jgi:hypothetical protein
LKELAELKQQLAALEARFDEAAKGGKATTGVEFNNRGTIAAQIAAYTEGGQPKRLAMGAQERSAPMNSQLFERGEIDKPGDVVPRGFIQVASRDQPSIEASSSGRLELANWLASRDNPLTARVFVNRVWAHLFNRGLVPTTDNFGAAGQPPDHPQLLDHLTLQFMDHGWSPKWLIRRIVCSRAYRQSTHHDGANYEADPDNTCVWRMSPSRLDAEVIRDSILDAAGKLDLTPPIGSAVALAGEDGSNKLLRSLPKLDTGNFHRAVYLPVIRDNVLESLSLFDFADPSLMSSQRAATTVPAQSLYLLNSPFILAAADAAALRLIAEWPDVDGRLRLAYLRYLGRPPTDAERQACAAFVEKYTAAGNKPSTVWSALCQSLICTADFLHRP